MNEILTKLRAELEAQPSPRTYEVARALTYLDSVDSETISSPSIERLEKANEALVRALEEVSQVLTVEEHQNPGKGWGDFLEKDVLPALKLAKEPA